MKLQSLVFVSTTSELAIVIGRKFDPRYFTIRTMYGHKISTEHKSYLTYLGSLYDFNIPFRNYSSSAECLHYHPELLV